MMFIQRLRQTSVSGFVLLLLLAACSAPAAPGAQQPSASTAASSSAAPAGSVAAQAPSGDVPTLDYYYVATSARSEDLQQVEDAMNAMLVPKIGAKIKLRPLSFAEITTKAPLILQSGEKCDLMAMSGFNPYNNGVATGGLLALDELLPQHAPKTWASHPAEIWNAARINGKIYGSVNDTGWGGFAGMWARQDLLDKYKFDYAKTTKVEEWEPYFDQILANEPGVTPLISTDGYWGRTWFANYYGYDPIDTSIGAPQSQGAIGVKVDDTSRKVVAVAFTPEYKQAVELARRWYTKGYYLQTPPTDSEMGAMRSALKFAAFHFPGTGEFSTQSMSANEWNNVPVVTHHLQERPILTTGSIAGSVTAVCAVSEHPDLAVKYIEEINNNVELFNLINFGLEGKHWVWKDQSKNLVGYPDGVDGQTVGYNPNAYWQFGDRHQLRLTDPADVDVFERIDANLERAIYSPVLGFTPDRSAIQNEIAQVSTVAKQYCDPLEKGLSDPAQGLAECQNKLKEAGIDTAVAEIQRQVDAWAQTNVAQQ